MPTPYAVSDPVTGHNIVSKLRDYYTLTKPEVNLLSVAGGLYLAAAVNRIFGSLF